jgi:hypothetical protein
MLDPAAAIPEEWSSEETIDFIRVLGSTQDHHSSDHGAAAAATAADADDEDDDDKYWAMVASRMEGLGRGYPARSPHHLKCKCQSLLSAYMKVLNPLKLLESCSDHSFCSLMHLSGS